MSSFTKSARREKSVLSTGMERFDAILGGHIAKGASIAIIEDENSKVHMMMLKIFLSEGDSNGENIVAVTKEGFKVEVYETVSFIEKTCDEKMVIAWRYLSSTSGGCLPKFNLSAKKQFEGTLISGEKATLENILEVVRNTREHRIAIFSLMSPIWKYSGCTDSETKNFLFQLKKFTRLNNHVCMVSMPEFSVKSIVFEPYFDVVAHFNSHIFSGLCPNYNGILEFKKLSEYKCFRVNRLSSLKYGVKVKKNGLLIENIEIPPEEVEPENISCATKREF